MHVNATHTAIYQSHTLPRECVCVELEVCKCYSIRCTSTVQRLAEGKLRRGLWTRGQQYLHTPTPWASKYLHTPTPWASKYLHTPTSWASKYLHTPTPWASEYLHTPTPWASEYLHTPTSWASKYLHTPTPWASKYLHTPTPWASKYLHTPTSWASKYLCVSCPLGAGQVHHEQHSSPHLLAHIQHTALLLHRHLSTDYMYYEVHHRERCTASGAIHEHLRSHSWALDCVLCHLR